MYRSVWCAIAAMIRYQERQRSPRAAPWPDYRPRGASTADRWAYVYCRAARQGAPFEPEDDRDPLIVVILFARYDRRKALTRLYLEHKRIGDLPGLERTRARRMRAKFIRELCHRGLLEVPQKGCPRFAREKYCPRARGCRAD